MKIPNIIPWTPEIDHQFCDEFWQLSETHRARVYMLALGKRVVEILGSGPSTQDRTTAVCLFTHLKNNDKASFIDTLTQQENKSIGAIIQCMKKRARNLFSPKGLPWTGRYYRFRRPDLIANKFLSTQEEVQLYKDLFSQQESIIV